MGDKITTAEIKELLLSERFDEVIQLGEKAIGPLIKLLGDECFLIREHASYCLSEIGAPSLEALERALDNKDKNVRMYVVKTLGDIKESSVRLTLHRALCDRNEGVREQAAFALGNTGNRITLGVLRRLLQVDASPHVRTAASDSIERIRSRLSGAGDHDKQSFRKPCGVRRGPQHKKTRAVL